MSGWAEGTATAGRGCRRGRRQAGRRESVGDGAARRGMPPRRTRGDARAESAHVVFRVAEEVAPRAVPRQAPRVPKLARGRWERGRVAVVQGGWGARVVFRGGSTEGDGGVGELRTLDRACPTPAAPMRAHPHLPQSVPAAPRPPQPPQPLRPRPPQKPPHGGGHRR